MNETSAAPLESAYDALRAWCHERPDLDDPSAVYATLGSLTMIIATLEHIVGTTVQSVARATGADDERVVTDAVDYVGTLTGAAIQSFELARRSIADAHAVVSHLVFALHGAHDD